MNLELIHNLKSIENGLLILSDLEEETSQRLRLTKPLTRKSPGTPSMSGLQNIAISYIDNGEDNFFNKSKSNCFKHSTSNFRSISYSHNSYFKSYSSSSQQWPRRVIAATWGESL